MFRFLILVAALFSVSAYAYNIDKNQISVSGLSSGAYMAGQIHVAYSDIFMGAGLIAGGPYYCAQKSAITAQVECMGAPTGTVLLDELIAEAKRLEKAKLIASLSNLISSQVYIFNGENDAVVVRPVSDETVNFYKKLGVSPTNIQYVTELPAGHSFPTENYGNECETVRASPFISNCGYDTAGSILNHIYGELKVPIANAAVLNNEVRFKKSNILKFAQKKYLAVTPKDVSLAEEAFAYVPPACARGEKCRLHFAFHGCKQTTEDIGELFYTKTGYNDWAVVNNIIVIYPQAVRTFITNPNGCWDWWGYTGGGYHTRKAPQMQMIFKMVQDFTQPAMRLRSL